MTDSAITIIVGGVLALANIVAGFLMWRTKTVAEAALAQSKENKEITEKTHAVVNSRMDEFKDMAEKYFTAEGALQEKKAEQERKALIAATLATAPAPGGAHEMKIINSPAEPVPTITTGAEIKPGK